MSDASTSTLNQDRRELGLLVAVKGEQAGRGGCLNVCPTLNISALFFFLCSIDFLYSREGRVACPMPSKITLYPIPITYIDIDIDIGTDVDHHL